MNRTQLEHAIRASTEILKQDRVIIIGSQSILGSWDERDLPEQATASIEVDICPMQDDDAESLADVLDGAIGEWSNFHSTHGFYIQGVGRRTAILAEGWADRLIPVRTNSTGNGTGLCLEPHDLCAAKLLANREKDHTFVRALIDDQIVDPNVVWNRIDATSTEPERKSAARSFLRPMCEMWSALGLSTRSRP